ncbi:MAG: type II toxin-antitoxin system VapC family toxin [Planctomycetales bacterium]|nr:type II toxin-antitoxin system VapC family toxin [Planctomycetales bacterium]MCA9220718.1 type II toxin-antitoxin system VapC family toxin [Planctomycetales bacterium]MCA9224396.1 type II toxin-antitoxin system VapC family toxin [Planctomycetales bacterium]
MIRYLLDTDTVSLLQDLNKQVVAQVALHPPDEIGTSIVTVEEQLSAWYTLLRRARTSAQLVPVYERMTRAVNFLSNVPLLSFDAVAATTYDQLRKRYPRKGKMDLRIAAIAIANSCTLVSRNLVDFQDIEGLAVEDWA